MSMNIVFMGSPDFAVPTLKKLLASDHNLSAIVTQPDRPKGRGRAVSPPPVKVCALSSDVPILQPEKASDPGFIAAIREMQPDLLAVVAYGQILKQELLDIPKHFCMNVHSSLLPKYRGAAPINRAVINGDAETGVTTMKMALKMDAGDILLVSRLAIDPADTAQTVHDRLAELGADLTLKTIEQLEKGELQPISQNESEVTFAPKLSKEDGLIDWSRCAEEINNLIRGVQPWPGAYSFLKGKRIRIWKAEVLSGEESKRAGAVIKATSEGIEVQTGKGRINILEMQPEGKKRLDVKSFLLGNAVEAGDAFTISDNS